VSQTPRVPKPIQGTSVEPWSCYAVYLPVRAARDFTQRLQGVRGKLSDLDALYAVYLPVCALAMVVAPGDCDSVRDTQLTQRCFLCSVPAWACRFRDGRTCPATAGRQDLRGRPHFHISEVEMTWRPCLVTLYLGLGRRGADLCQQRLSVAIRCPDASSADSVCGLRKKT
jgi:hypothetical protein